jgi:arginine/lysine/ornithine decarboxylase
MLMVRKNEENQNELFSRLLGNIDKQIEMDTKLKDKMESLFTHVSKSTKSRTIEDTVLEIRNMYIEAEILQAEGRAVFHQLFGTKFEY